MESHIFGEPVPVVYYPVSSNSDDEVALNGNHKSDVEPSWTVDVIRRGSNVVVGTIVINNTKLPPRRNKNKKVVWKLPTANNTGTDEDVPRFGKQDYPRLWEIYKEEKKKRRKATMITTSSNNSTDDNGNNCSDNDSTTDTAKVQSAVLKNIDKVYSTNEPFDEIHSSATYQNQAAAAAAPPNICMIAPPPGFESTASTTATNTGGFGHNGLERDMSSAATTTVRPPPGFS